MLQLASQFPESCTGIAPMPAEEYFEQDPDTATLSLRTGDTYAGPDDNFHVLTASELAAYNKAHGGSSKANGKGPVKWGCTYQSYCVNVSVYLCFLLRHIQARGARVVRVHVDSLRRAFELGAKLGFRSAATVVDCSGRGVMPDPKTNVIRGQTVLVKQQYHKTVTRQCKDGQWVFLIPRPADGGTIVGGTKEVGLWDGCVRTGLREDLLKRAKECYPEFVGEGQEWVVIRDNVGWRPWRDGGLRVEAADLNGGVGHMKRRVVYGYGAGGRGYELSWGVAEKLAGLIDEVESQAAGLEAKI